MLIRCSNHYTAGINQLADGDLWICPWCDVLVSQKICSKVFFTRFWNGAYERINMQKGIRIPSKALLYAAWLDHCHNRIEICGLYNSENGLGGDIAVTGDSICWYLWYTSKAAQRSRSSAMLFVAGNIDNKLSMIFGNFGVLQDLV